MPIGRWLATGALLAGCYNPQVREGAPCETTSQCPGEQVCDLGTCVLVPGMQGDAALADAVEDAAAKDAPSDSACPATTCASAAVLSTCGVDTECPNGCIDEGPDGVDRCGTIALSNGLTPQLLQPGIAANMTTGLVVLNTDTGEVLSGGGTVRPPGTGVSAGIGFTLVGTLGVFTVDSLVVTSNGTLRAIGSRVLVVFARHDITVNGRLDVSAGVCSATAVGPQCPGPNGGRGGSVMLAAGGCAPGGLGQPMFHTGGGGGGFGGLGGSGGLATMGPELGGKGGMTLGACAPARLEPIVGGSGGGAGGPTSGGLGGGGGGAVQLTALGTVTVSPNGVVVSGGGGGSTSTVENHAGGGGGSGGAILLEGDRVVVRGVVAANGGGGGAGDNLVNDGETGGAGAAVALGGIHDGVDGSDGGNGGALIAGAQNGAAGGTATGGGGGGVGKIAIHAATRDVLGTVSPTPGFSGN